MILEEEAFWFRDCETLLSFSPQKPTPADLLLFAHDELMLLSAVEESKLIAAVEPVQRPRDAKLLVLDEDGRIAHASRADFDGFLARGDLGVELNPEEVPPIQKQIVSATRRHTSAKAFGAVTRLSGS